MGYRHLYNLLTLLQIYSYEKCPELVNTENVFSWKPLHYIAERKELELMKLLLNKGAGK